MGHLHVQTQVRVGSPSWIVSEQHAMLQISVKCNPALQQHNIPQNERIATCGKARDGMVTTIAAKLVEMPWSLWVLVTATFVVHCGCLCYAQFIWASSLFGPRAYLGLRGSSLFWPRAYLGLELICLKIIVVNFESCWTVQQLNTVQLFNVVV